MAKNAAVTAIKKHSEKRTLVMGILNATPDSFSDGGLYHAPKRALFRVKTILAEGVDIIDIGGESTRPGSQAVSVKEEIARTAPIIKAIRKKFGKGPLLSIDTNKAEVAEAALRAGANMVNSLGGFMFDYELAAVVAKAGCPIVIYHIKGEPRTMQTGTIKYKNVVAEINTFFKQEIAFGMARGIRRDQFILDPGIGFGKTVEHNLSIVKNFKTFKKWKVPLLIGPSRKSHLGQVLQKSLGLKKVPPPIERMEAGLAEAGIAVLSGASIVRTHDILQTKKFLAIIDACK